MMFGFDETIEYKPSPEQDFKDAIKTMLDYIDGTTKYNKKFVDEYLVLFKNAEKLYSKVSLPVQQQSNLYWSSITSMVSQFPMFCVSGQISAFNALDTMVPMHRSHVFSLYGILS